MCSIWTCVNNEGKCYIRRVESNYLQFTAKRTIVFKRPIPPVCVNFPINDPKLNEFIFRRKFFIFNSLNELTPFNWLLCLRICNISLHRMEACHLEREKPLFNVYHSKWMQQPGKLLIILMNLIYNSNVVIFSHKSTKIRGTYSQFIQLIN